MNSSLKRFNRNRLGFLRRSQNLLDEFFDGRLLNIGRNFSIRFI